MESYVDKIVNNRKKESIIDRPLNKRFKYDPIKQRLLYNTLPQPLKATPYAPPKPVLKPRTKRGAPIALPRKQVPKKVTEKVKKIKKLIEEINKFKENLKFIQEVEITQKKKAIKNNALSFEATIVNNYDPLIQLTNTGEILKEKSKTLIEEKR